MHIHKLPNRGETDAKQMRNRCETGAWTMTSNTKHENGLLNDDEGK